jgi:transcriptional regulator with XRE-family HTH domain
LPAHDDEGEPAPGEAPCHKARRPEAAGVSQEALAAQADLHRNYVGLLERGKQIPSILVVEKLAAALGTTMSSLMREVEKATDEK